MAFDFKKEFKEFYMLKNKPANVASMDNNIEENGYRNDFSDVREPLINRFFSVFYFKMFFLRKYNQRSFYYLMYDCVKPLKKVQF